MELNQSISVQLVDGEGRPLLIGDVLVEINFFIKGKYRYGWGVGRSNELGRLNFSGADMEAIRVSNAAYNLMDYNTKLDACDTGVKIVVPSDEELRERFENVIKSYGTSPEWAKHWPANARVHAKPKFVELVGQVMSVDIPTSVLT